ncbi:MAG: arsenite methyltransferase [Firmicutes bacterium]|nr:arsenite methyltransferase [Bacillota bacterium]
MNQIPSDTIRQYVRDRYRQIADPSASQDSCCDSGCGCGTTPVDYQQISAKMGYSDTELSVVPDGANLGLGCGNPQAIAELKAGETVLDLGSGGGFDCFLASKQVGATGKVIGVDMTPEMVTKARYNAVQGGYRNVEFRLGEIENLPVADNSVDCIISNCVINLSPEKPQVFREAFRVLKQGGRLAVSDIVTTRNLPDHIKKDMNSLSGCISGASSMFQIESMLKDAGFGDILIAAKDESRQFIKDWIPDANIENFIVSAVIKAVKV